MGCNLSSCCDKDEGELDVADERTRLLSDPVSISTSASGVQSDDLLVQRSNSSPKSTDEQSVLNKILQVTATNVIDVAALAPSTIEQNEYLERRSHYHSKLSPVSWQTGIKSQCYLVDIPIPEKVFNSNPISTENALLIKRAASKIKTALSELKVYHSEDLIVPFAIP
ncbi:ragulator complex protein LAMTOR1 [Halyomorpha halys]|uniref:ragulator complex protein LAMTOR1 n=1 Tax=Halyomorpha halys TaxID=286706 RepID=UPI0006D50AD5|nr:ragulator complex protein LAMTOR1 [Halyomorpha halys]